MTKTKVMIISRLFYPQKIGGGPIQSITNLVKSVKNEFELYIITVNHEYCDNKPLDGVKNGWNNFDFGNVYYFPYSESTYKNVYKLIEAIIPDVIYQNSFFSHSSIIPALYYAYKHKNVKLIIAPRGELCKNALKQKSIKKRIYIILLRIMGIFKYSAFHFTSEEELFDFRELFAKKMQNIVYNIIPNISMIENDMFVPLEKKSGYLRMIYIARIHSIKNLITAIKALQTQTGHIIYDIYGPIEQEQYWNLCQQEIKKLPPNVNVNYCGILEHDDISKKISSYHVFFMPTLSENFGHSIVESLLCSRPVIISDKTPWTDLKEYGGGVVIELDDMQGYENAIKHFAQMEQEEFLKECNKAKQYITQKIHITDLVTDYIKMLEKNTTKL